MAVRCKMLKKTTVYISDEDKLLLKKLAAAKEMSLSDALRYSIRKTCKPSSKEEKEFWDTIEKVWDRNKEVDPAEVDVDVQKSLDEVRLEKSRRRRSS